MTGDGLIDLDTARASANEALAKAGGKVTAYGISFDRSDIDALFEIAQNVTYFRLTACYSMQAPSAMASLSPSFFERLFQFVVV